MNRHTAREKALQILFQMDLHENESQAEMEEMLVAEGNEPFLRNLVEGVRQRKEELDGMITDKLENWSFDRIASVEKTILRIAVYEINYLDDIPSTVSINEAVELGNRFGDEKSGKFINGVLSKIIA
ncbi:transcription antitermination factor NusB [Virgibacillus xinjiangensis]|uniref:Transcription antitermination protein NusB n=1 Tax=Virgibacillus xinjiangensis TaxID=393090 RepID=A0ABV7CRJ4_9BACI